MASSKVGIVDSLETTPKLRRSVFDWEDLQVFHAVATGGSMSAAAQTLGCQQSTVSKRIRQLEGRLGARLIERRADGIGLTPAGEKALDYVTTMQRSARQLESELADADKSMSGQVSVGAPDGLATYWLSRHLPRFMRLNPEIHLVLNKSGPTGTSGPAPDLSIDYVPEKDIDTHATALGTLHFMPFASREFINTYGAPKSAHEALNLRFLKLEQYNPDLELWGKRVETIDAYINYNFHTDTSSVLFETMMHGGGIAMAPTYIAALYPEDLVVLDYNFRQDVRFWLKYHPETQRVGRTKQVGDWIVEAFNRKNNPWFRDEFCHPCEFSDIEVIRTQK